MNSEKYYVINHEYFNSGGNCMLSIFTVYCREDNVTRYAICNEDGLSWQTVDTVSCAELFEYEEILKATISQFDWKALTSEPSYDQHLFAEDEYELFKYCQFEFYSRDCSNSKIKYSVPLDWLPANLFNSLSDEERDWLKENDSYIETDGRNVYMPHDYIDWQEKQSIAWQQRVNDFKKWFDYQVHPDHSNDEILELYTKAITLTFNGRSVELPFDADTYSAVSALLDNIIKEW